jgi:hypothetical protein
MPVTRIDQAALGRILVGPSGAVAADLLRRAIRVESRAKQLCPVDTGRLRSSITHELVKSGGGVMLARIGTNVSYARDVHEGTRPHVIRPRSARVLRFPAGGRIVYTAYVNHPGTRGRPFLRDALPAAAG